MSGPPFTVKAIFDYTSDHDDDLNFAIGQIITVTEEEDADWYYGEYPDESGSKRQGIFPRNFVEKYEPAAPPRPVRPSRVKKELESTPQTEPVAETTPSGPEPELDAEGETEASVNSRIAVSRNILPPPPPPEGSAPEGPKQLAVPPPPPTLAEPVQKPAAKPPPPAAATKPVSSSFKDRIAAFNKPTAPPIAPFKPGGLSSQNPNTFIRKQFVAPPPSKDAYVIQPREPAPKVYRREEDPEIVDLVNREPPVSEGRPATNESAPEAGEDQPKPTSLKERIALLQKQQLEQAARHAEAALKKEKPKKPPKKRPDAHEQLSVPAEGTDLERIDVAETARDYTAETVEETNRLPPAPATPHVLSSVQPSQELVSDTNDADHSGAGDTEDAEETSTSREDYEDRPPPRSHSKDDAVDNGEQEGAEEDGEEEEEEEVDPEVKRKMELRERMAKMSGGMGMMGMFGPPPGAMRGVYGAGARKPKTAPPDGGRRPSDDSERVSSPVHAPPVSIMALPGMNARRPPELVSSPKEVEREEKELRHNSVAQLHSPADEVSDVEDAGRPQISAERAPPPPPPPHVPPLTESRPAPPRVPSVSAQTVPTPPAPETRPVPPPPISPPLSLSPGEDSDDELSSHATTKSLNAITSGTVAPALPPPLPPHVVDQSDPSSSPLRRSSTYDSTSLKSPTLGLERRLSRPPPIPGNPPQQSPPLTRPPPPPPPVPPSRQSTADSRPGVVLPAPQLGEDTEGEVTEYDGDYDTDITPGAKFKDALKAHERDSSLDEGTITDDVPLHPPRGPPENRPPPPLPTAPRAVPPPPPNQPPKSHRVSTENPRPLPPPIPLPKEHFDDDEYDPYHYPRHGVSPPLPLPPTGRPTAHLPAQQQSSQDNYDELYDVSPIHTQSQPPQPPPPPPPERTAIAPLPFSEPPSASRNPRSSLDVSRGPGNTRRSMDISRPSVDQSFIATDVDLAQGGMWWTQANNPPPIFQNRKDVLYEVEESTLPKRGGKTTISKDVYVLFMDYSQTIINARFDARNPADKLLQQRHEPPPNRPRQDQLENAHMQFGSRISEAVTAIQNTTVADGTPHGLIHHLVSPLTDALLPVGTRAYGALVYANLANASVQQHDEIRAGDIVSFRNARFQGHRGTMHQKYHVEVGKPDHVGIVVDWDGTKKKIHSWEQGRESRKVKVESFKLGDLKSGECKVWRVMPRSWVGWESSKG